MTNFEKALEEVLNIEGGYTDDKADSGGKTKYGVTESVARRCGYEGEMKDLELETAKAIYKEEYWDKLKLDGIEDYDIAEEIFEQFVNMGNAIKKFMQRAANILNRSEKDWEDIEVDGKPGNKTIAAINLAVSKRKENYLKVLNVLQGNYYIELAERREKDERFINGWLGQRVVLPLKKNSK